MSSAMDISAAGMQAASRWFSATASNIVALTSAPAVPGPAAPKPADASDDAAVPGLPPFLLAYDSQAPYANMQGMVAVPDGDLATQMVHLHEAANSFRANLLALKVSSRMIDNLLDTLA
jgi:flagellar basal-body rod protein FlgC